MADFLYKIMSEVEKGNVSYIVPVICILLLIIVFNVLLGRLIQKIKDKKLMDKSRSDAVKRSRAVLGGQFGEQLSPFLPDFPCNPGDVRFVGKPVDYVAFPGSAEGREIEEVLFIEVKSGSSKLSQREKEIKQAVQSGKVRYVEYHLPEL